MKIIIVEDEIVTANDLARTLVAINPNIEVVAFIQSIDDGVDFFSSNTNFDLIFSDIELTDGLSFEIYDKCQIKAPIIFCTAYNHYALEAFKLLSLDYILKPFSKESIAPALQKFEQLKDRFSTETNLIQNLIQTFQQKEIKNTVSSIIVTKGEKMIPISIESIALFLIEGNVVFGQTFDNQQHIVNSNLEKLETITFPDFYRVNRQFLVNRKAIKEVSHYFGRKLLLHLSISFKEQITVGKEKASQFMDWLVEN